MKKFSTFTKETLQLILFDFLDVCTAIILFYVVWTTYHDSQFISATGFPFLFMWVSIAICTLEGARRFFIFTISFFGNIRRLWKYRSEIYEN